MRKYLQRLASFSCGLLVGWMLLLATAAQAADAAPAEAPSVRQRFAEKPADDTKLRIEPDFQRHVIPLLSTLGCSGRNCHGASQGQGGFRLSLFGYDFAADHLAIANKSRLNRETPAKSLLLEKPLTLVDHEGGERIQAGSWQHHLLEAWIAAGAKREKSQRLISLVITPPEMVLQPGKSQTYSLVASWSDGTSEEVSGLARVEIRSDEIARLTDAGAVKAAGHGDTHLVAIYDAMVVSIPIIVPHNTSITPRQMTSTHRVDQLVQAKLDKLGIEPSQVASDAEFLRRATLDIIGTLPTPEEVQSFLADDRADKRSRKIDELLAHPMHAAWWSIKLAELTGGAPNQQSDAPQQFSQQWYDWLARRLAENMPYDQIVAGMLLAESRPAGATYRQYAAEMSSYFRDEEPAEFASRATLPHYWSRKSLQEPRAKALAVSHAFLGIRLECAECHKHPHDQWTQQDFRDLGALLSAIQYGVPADARDEQQQLMRELGGNLGPQQSITADLLAKAADGKLLPWRELYIAREVTAPPAILQLPVDDRTATDPRQIFYRWLLQENNPFFARAIVNRVWRGYFHRGLVDPTDDASPANPASNEPLLQYLSQEFVRQKYDLRWLHREIASSDTYQRSWRPSATNASDTTNFSRFLPRQLPAEVLYDALKQVSLSTDDLNSFARDPAQRAAGKLSPKLQGSYAMLAFGKPAGLAMCDCERTERTTLLQSIFTQNDPLVQLRLENISWGGSLAQKALIEEAYLRTFSRPPTSDEAQRVAAQLGDDFENDRAEAVRRLLWSLVNSKEFLLNH